MEWLHEPPSWTREGNMLIVTAAPKTDFWRKTHSGAINDNGHFYGQPVEGDFTAEVKFSADYAALYDQAGLMVRLNEAYWMKCGIEYVDGVHYASAVVTRDFSDWSVARLDPPEALWLRVVRHGVTVEVSFSLDGGRYTMLRQAYLTDAPVQVGPMICAPTGPGFTARFEQLAISKERAE